MSLFGRRSNRAEARPHSTEATAPWAAGLRQGRPPRPKPDAGPPPPWARGLIRPLTRARSRPQGAQRTVRAAAGLGIGESWAAPSLPGLARLLGWPPRKPRRVPSGGLVRPRCGPVDSHYDPRARPLVRGVAPDLLTLPRAPARSARVTAADAGPGLPRTRAPPGALCPSSRQSAPAGPCPAVRPLYRRRSPLP